MIYLMRQGEALYYILNSETDTIGAMHDDVPSIINTVCIASAASMAELLHTLQETKDERWFVVTDSVDNNGVRRSEKYSQHQHLHKLFGFIPQVCDIQQEHMPYFAEWEVDYISELWYRHSDELIVKVRYFTENMLREVDQYLTEHKLLK